MDCVSISLDYNMATSVQFLAFFSIVLIISCKCFHIYNASFKSLLFPCLRQLPDIYLLNGCSFPYVHSLLLSHFPPPRNSLAFIFLFSTEFVEPTVLEKTLQMLYQLNHLEP